MEPAQINNQASPHTDSLAKLQQSVRSVIRGKDEAIQLALVTLLARGHLLIEDVPGVGKTTLAHSLGLLIMDHCHRTQNRQFQF